MMLFTPSVICKWHAVLLDIHAGISNMKISQCSGVNLRTDLYSYWWKTKHPVHIMVFGVVTSNSDVISSFILWHGLTLNMAAYIKCQNEVMQPWTERVTVERPCIWQQDSAPYHTSRRSQCCLWENFCDHITPNIWSPNSPNCHHLDYYNIWGTIDWARDLQNMWVHTPVTLLRSLSGKYPWERYEPPSPPSYGLNSTTTVLLGE